MTPEQHVDSQKLPLRKPSSALLTALPCLLGGAGLILIPWLLLTALERWRNRSEAAEMELPYSDQAAEKEEPEVNTRAGSF